MRKLYLAGPLFNPKERAFNLELEEMLSPFFSIYLPQRDGVLVPSAQGKKHFEQLSRDAYALDVQAIAGSDVLLAILDGRTVDEGVAFELGFASALGKRCIALKTDSRVLLPHGDNPMITGAISSWFASVQKLVAWAAERA